MANRFKDVISYKGITIRKKPAKAGFVFLAPAKGESVLAHLGCSLNEIADNDGYDPTSEKKLV